MRSLLIAVTFLACLLSLLAVSVTPWRRRLRLLLVRWWCARLVWAFGARVKVIGTLPQGPHLIVCNHLSYFDVVVGASLLPAVFVTSTDLPARNPLINLFVRVGGCLMVDRQKKTTLLRDIKEMSILLDSGTSIFLYPEASSTGGTMLPFKPALITAAAHGGVPVLALAIRYPSLTAETRDDVFFYDGMDFLPHLFALTRRGGFEVEIEVCGSYPATSNRKDFARFLEKVIDEKTLDYLGSITV